MTDFPHGPIDYERETPGPTGRYRNMVEYPTIIQSWSNDKLLLEYTDIVVQRTLMSSYSMKTNQVRLELMARAQTAMHDEILERM